ncbi:ScbA/BarX family gamma-butyrolactone biosynthesis protein [Streptomyces sp. NPDC058274]|uniref:ScbA/BarX family gamma-butyrolactone biosynthesis protein n=1 Tax=Streptomyces sp. NPDC058274 TaxID=3346416 RepID=UPI0036EDF829
MTATVPRQLVHRAAVAEVFLTGWSALDGERTRVLAQWPRAHSLYRPVEGRYDPMLAAETIRQAGVLVAHAVHGVPLGHRFLMWGLHFAVHPENLTVGSRPAELELDVAFTEIRGSGSRLGGRYTVTIRSAGRVVATGGAHFTCTSPAVYRRLREARLAQSTTAGVVAGADLPSVAPVSVGRDSARDVVLAPGGTPRRWQLRVDTSHPILFDHPDDHVPGMVLLEAARQAAATLSPPGAAPLLVSMDNTFDRYVEFDTPCWIEAEVPDGQPDHVRIVGRQDGEQVFSCLLSTSPSGA